jgi:hypothetical protein
MFGQGSFNVSQNPNPGTAGPPFSALSADNGLSVDPVSGRIVLGQSVGAAGDPGQLLSNREVPLKGFSFTLGEAGSSHFIVNPAGAYLLGDLSGLGNGSNIGVVDASKQLRFNSGGAIYFDISAGIGSYRMGDVSTVANGSLLSINDATQFMSLDSGGASYLTLDIAGGYFAFGDDFSIGTGTELTMDNNLGRIHMYTKINGVNNQRVFTINSTTNTYEIGDLNTANNGAKFTVNDATGAFIFGNAANNSTIAINGVAGFTGTVAPVNTITVIGGIVTAVA